MASDPHPAQTDGYATFTGPEAAVEANDLALAVLEVAPLLPSSPHIEPQGILSAFPTFPLPTLFHMQIYIPRRHVINLDIARGADCIEPHGVLSASTMFGRRRNTGKARVRGGRPPATTKSAEPRSDTCGR